MADAADAALSLAGSTPSKLDPTTATAVQAVQDKPMSITTRLDRVPAADSCS